MTKLSRVKFANRLAVGVWLGLGGALAAPATAAAQSAGLAVVIGNSYEGFLPGSLVDAEGIANKLDQSGFDTVRLLDVAAGELAAGLDQIRRAAEGAGPVRVVYTSGFGMCFNDDLVLFADDLQPEQFKSGQISDVVIPLSVVADAAAAGGGQTLVVFDTTPRQCTADSIDAVKLPEDAVLLVTTGIGGDVVEGIDEGGMSAFATAFVEAYAPERSLQEVISLVVDQIRELTDDQQQPILVGKL